MNFEMKPKTYKVLVTAVEDGVDLGIKCVLKYHNISEEAVTALRFSLTEELITSISEWFEVDREI